MENWKNSSFGQVKTEKNIYVKGKRVFPFSLSVQAE
jgi:hypothetical protein